MLRLSLVTRDEVRPLEADGLHAALHGGDGVVWVDLVGGRSDDDVAALGALDLAPLVLEDVLEDTVHPKAEAHGGYVFAVVHALDLGGPVDAGFEVRTAEFDVVLGRTWLFTHVDRDLDVLRIVRERLPGLLAADDPDRPSSSAQLLHLLLDTLVDEYLPFIDGFVPDRIDVIEEELFERPPPSTLARREIYLRRRDVLHLVRVTRPQAAAVRELATIAGERVCDERDVMLFRDVADRLDRVASAVDSLRDQLDSLFQHYHSVIGARQNQIVTVLTLVSATLLPMTVITGVYGMNFTYMPELRQRWGYPFALLLCVAILVASVTVFRARGWVGATRRSDRRARERAAGDRTELVVLGRRIGLPGFGDRRAEQLAPDREGR